MTRTGISGSGISMPAARLAIPRRRTANPGPGIPMRTPEIAKRMEGIAISGPGFPKREQDIATPATRPEIPATPLAGLLIAEHGRIIHRIR
ncbi:MAG TPA: hypothetical protein VEP28_11130 [Rubrobacter sp.]|nr:hypothetical protein [Rubrobacter sp.]